MAQNKLLMVKGGNVGKSVWNHHPKRGGNDCIYKPVVTSKKLQAMTFVMGLQMQGLQMLDLLLCYRLVKAWQSANIASLFGGVHGEKKWEERVGTYCGLIFGGLLLRWPFVLLSLKIEKVEYLLIQWELSHDLRGLPGVSLAPDSDSEIILVIFQVFFELLKSGGLLAGCLPSQKTKKAARRLPYSTPHYLGCTQPNQAASWLTTLPSLGFPHQKQEARRLPDGPPCTLGFLEPKKKASLIIWFLAFCLPYLLPLSHLNKEGSHFKKKPCSTMFWNSHCEFCTVTMHQILVELLWEKGRSKTKSFIVLSACQLQEVEQVFFFHQGAACPSLLGWPPGLTEAPLGVCHITHLAFQPAHPWIATIPAVIWKIYFQCAHYQEKDSLQMSTKFWKEKFLKANLNISGVSHLPLHIYNPNPNAMIQLFNKSFILWADKSWKKIIDVINISKLRPSLENWAFPNYFWGVLLFKFTRGPFVALAWNVSSQRFFHRFGLDWKCSGSNWCVFMTYVYNLS
ncbi:hypothetical protein VP01_1974g5 [Puccinia sorghi]|uniref:Uncharacterized protein n=1 Tax=Puccinia sorghi TaxID=27349 RepID=A0A0L6VDL4_9BASI|nr:hypothetical protein VP01_1974g5 [Puccinia sorghi]